MGEVHDSTSPMTECEPQNYWLGASRPPPTARLGVCANSSEPLADCYDGRKGEIRRRLLRPESTRSCRNADLAR